MFPLSDLVAAFMLLTRLPVARVSGGRAPAAIAESVWAYPIVGAVVGGIAAAVYAACHASDLPPSVSVVWALAALVLTTGGLHEDGLADSADAMGGNSPEQRLRIMRDSRIGSFGALALMLAFAERGTALVAVAQPWRVAACLIAAGALGRGAMLIVLLVAKPARPDGLAAELRSVSGERAAAGLGLAASAAVALLPWHAALSSIGGALAAALTVAWIGRRQLGGYTGDVLGATCVLAECVVLGLLSAVTW